MRVRPIEIWETLVKKKLFHVWTCSFYRLETKGWGWLRSRINGQYKGSLIIKSLNITHNQKISLVPQIRNKTSSSSNFRVKIITHSWKYTFWALGYSLWTLPWQKKKNLRWQRPWLGNMGLSLCLSNKEQDPCKIIPLPKLLHYNVRNHKLAGSWNCAIFSGRQT